MHAALGFELPTGIVGSNLCCTCLCATACLSCLVEGISVHLKYLVRFVWIFYYRKEMFEEEVHIFSKCALIQYSHVYVQ